MSIAMSQNQKKLTGGKVLAMVVAFFAVMLIADGAGVFFALDTFPGLIVKNPYEKGLKYNQTLRKRTELRDRGWQLGVSILPAAKMREIRITLKDRDALPLSGIVSGVLLKHPVDSRRDMSVDFNDRENGEYALFIDPAIKGQWLLEITLSDPKGETFLVEREIWLE